MQSDSEPFGDELNLAHLLGVLLRYWYFLVIGGVLGVLVVLLWSRMQPLRYAASASLVVIRSGLIVSFDPRVRSVSDTDLTSQALDQLTHRKSLITLGQSPDIAQAVIRELGDQLPPDLRDPGRLLTQIQVQNDSDVIQISATASSPQLAQQLANLWAKKYEELVNQVLGENALNSQDLDAQLQDAKKEYDAREQALVTFIATSSGAAQQSKIDLLDQQLKTRNDVRNKLAQLEQDATALKARMSAGGATVARGDALAQVLLEANAFNNGGGDAPAVRLDVPLDSPAVSQADQLAQLDGLVRAIQDRRAAMTEQADADLAKQRDELQGQLEQGNAKQKELEALRDLAWNTYQSLGTKVAERTVTNGSPTMVVRLTLPALTGALISSRLTLNLLIGGMFGVLIGGAGALAWGNWRRERTPVRASPLEAPLQGNS
jgi:uncharacterized protein involved in exopolysaccharide biosynthesis